MLITQIFGKYLRDTHSWINWFLNNHEVTKIHWDKVLMIDDCNYINMDLLETVHTILDQPMSEKCLEMFKGEWDWYELGGFVTISLNGEVAIQFESKNKLKLNAFVTHCHSKNIPLELNENYHVHL